MSQYHVNVSVLMSYSLSPDKYDSGCSEYLRLIKLKLIQCSRIFLENQLLVWWSKILKMNTFHIIHIVPGE